MGTCAKKIILVALVCFFSGAVLFAQEPSSATAANRQTAIRCLEQCKVFSTNSQWQETYKWAAIGIDYDSSIPDLWYMYALAAFSLQKPKAEVLSYIATSLDGENWIQYNKNAARILYADLLSDTLEWQKSLSILNQQPLLTTADAEYIRAKTYYRLGNPARAHAIIRTALMLFPADERFPLLFFKTERTLKTNPAGLELADLLVKNSSLWQPENPEIILFASPFIPAAEERDRFMRSYNALGNTHQLYAVFALNYGIIDEVAAFDYIKNYAENAPLDFAVLHEFASLIQSNDTRIAIQEWLTAFEGTLIFDTNKDGIYDLFADYSRGRTTRVRYEKKQNGINTWQALCDFGIPTKISIDNREIMYGNYPAIRTVFIAKATGTDLYELNTNALLWSPLTMEKMHAPPLLTELYIPVPKKMPNEITERMLISFASAIQIPLEERVQASARFTMLNGRPVSAVYSSKGQPYAFAAFENGIPQFRNVDADGNGFYEITERYAFNPQTALQYQSEAEQKKLSRILFGPMPAAEGLYMAKISADLSGNGDVDYETTILPYNGYVSKWKATDGKGWNVSYTKRAITNTDGAFSGNYTEESFFTNPITREEITVIFTNGTPVSVRTNRGTKKIEKDPLYNLYWIGTQGDAASAKKIVETLNLYPTTTVSIIENYGTDSRILAVTLGTLYFGEIF